ncbi:MULTISPECIES: antitoxin Xre/MbcA/ParS toxin-binding domain-containing protein [unclassified Imperialibacter]|uniref:antitoxin Xre/MbcA/ParS toxin-binding domain-containing protein n=1 Tax=unclassified Imperialibacter TaxID=2629706 RepID=UPI00125B67F5|nr:MULTISPECIES: antitoxin Xre/MbcA/ParS toxin-binding domain-containing protein [unclassified Imperialibacter]CAD5252041.1 conserved hypothetical protein [Imperialibacter sp. 75]CAD5298135.1 conserved hypothetical protein [Imperialibacter sp. 89]VVT13376.1 conserved hypothetical protein [Imperialibacter sp. EC-SDR9]
MTKEGEKSEASSWRIKTSSGETESINVDVQAYHFLKPYAQNDDPPLMAKEPELVYERIKPMVQYLGYSQQELSGVLEVDPSTLFRWDKGDKTIGKMRSKAMYDIDHIIAKGVKVFGSEKQLKEWLQTINQALGNQKPIELIKSPYGIELVDNAMEAMLWGNAL